MSVGDQDPFKTAENPYAAPATFSESPLPLSDSGELAGRMNRFGARIIDGIIGLVVTGPIMYATGYISRLQNSQVTIPELAAWTVGGFAIYIAIHGYLLATRGQTVGKMLAKIRIVDYHSDQLLSLPRLIGLRDVPIGLLSAIPFVGPLIGLANALFIFGGERRCLHDLIAGTKVVDV